MRTLLCRKAPVRLCLVLSFLVLSVLSVAAQTVVQPPHALAAVDSLLLQHRYADALALLETIAPGAGVPDGVVEDYRSICRRLGPIALMADSALKSFAENGKGLSGRFAPGDASARAAACYAEFLHAYDAGHYAAASERFTLAEFLRQGHVRREKERLMGNLELTRSLIKSKKFDEASALLNAFRLEPPTITYRSMKDTLERRYSPLEEAIRLGKVTEVYESKRVPVTGRFSFAGGAMLLPWQGVSYEQVRFINSSPLGGATYSYDSKEDAFSLSPLSFVVEAGYHVTPELYLGGCFGRATVHASGSFLSGGRLTTPVAFGADFKVDLLLFSVRYFLDARTGFRPYVGLAVGQVRWTITSDPASNSPLTVRMVDIEEKSVILVPGIGVQYIPFTSFPLTCSVSVDGMVRAREANVIQTFSLALGVKAGVIL